MFVTEKAYLHGTEKMILFGYMLLAVQLVKAF